MTTYQYDLTWLRKIPELFKQWFSVVSAVVLIICYGFGYLSVRLFFYQFDLDIGDFFTFSDYAAIIINHPGFISFVILLIFTQVMTITSKSDKPLHSPRKYIFINIVMMLLAVGVTIGIVIGQALQIKDGYGTFFNVYLSGSNQSTHTCEFIAETTKYLFCYEHNQERTYIINVDAIERLDLVKVVKAPECSGMDCEPPSPEPRK